MSLRSFRAPANGRARRLRLRSRRRNSCRQPSVSEQAFVLSVLACVSVERQRIGCIPGDGKEWSRGSNNEKTPRMTSAVKRAERKKRPCELFTPRIQKNARAMCLFLRTRSTSRRSRVTSRDFRAQRVGRVQRAARLYSTRRGAFRFTRKCVWCFHFVSFCCC